ncbi:PfkB family carbohydrate kinase [Streptosporangium vulgare]|uniref:PfkB family carbohydrate kinase n=1 Tax=Streptosporangium vulgare TaxID=46190 RepID=UPI0031DC2866
MRTPDIQGSDVLTLGETLVSLYVQGQRLDSASCLAKSIAGAEANVAIGLARLGARPAMISRVGPDPFGVEVHRTLRGEGVDVGHVRTGGSPTGMMVKEVLGPHLTNVYYYRARIRRDRADRRRRAGRPRRGSPPRARHGRHARPRRGPRRGRARALVGLARDHGVPVSFDPNIRRKLWTLEEAAAACRTLLPDVDDLLLGEDEALAISGTATCADALSALAGLGIRPGRDPSRRARMRRRRAGRRADRPARPPRPGRRRHRRGGGRVHRGLPVRAAGGPVLRRRPADRVVDRRPGGGPPGRSTRGSPVCTSTRLSFQDRKDSIDDRPGQVPSAGSDHPQADEDEARAAATEVLAAGVRLIEVTMTTPGALGLIRELAGTWPDAVVGAGTVLTAYLGGGRD